jgi:hypothetical protein
MIRNILLFFILLLALIPTANAQSGTVIFREGGFPAADSAPAPDSLLHALPDAQFASTAELKDRLTSAKLLVLPPPSQRTLGRTFTASWSAVATCSFWEAAPSLAPLIAMATPGNFATTACATRVR